MVGKKSKVILDFLKMSLLTKVFLSFNMRFIFLKKKPFIKIPKSYHVSFDSSLFSKNRVDLFKTFLIFFCKLRNYLKKQILKHQPKITKSKQIRNIM